MEEEETDEQFALAFAAAKTPKEMAALRELRPPTQINCCCVCSSYCLWLLCGLFGGHYLLEFKGCNSHGCFHFTYCITLGCGGICCLIDGCRLGGWLNNESKVSKIDVNAAKMYTFITSRLFTCTVEC